MTTKSKGKEVTKLELKADAGLSMCVQVKKDGKNWCCEVSTGGSNKKECKTPTYKTHTKDHTAFVY